MPPKKDPSEHRTIFSRIYFSTEEKRKLDELRGNAPVSVYVRGLIEMAWFNAESRRIHARNMEDVEYKRSHSSSILERNKFKTNKSL